MFLSFENSTNRRVHTKYYPPTVEIKDYKVMINGQNFFDQPAKNNLITYDNIQKTEANWSSIILQLFW